MEERSCTVGSFLCWALSSKESVLTVKEVIYQVPDTRPAQSPVSVIDKCLLSCWIENVRCSLIPSKTMKLERWFQSVISVLHAKQKA